MSVIAVIAFLLCGFTLATTTALLTARDIRQHQLRTGILTPQPSPSPIQRLIAWLSEPLT